jgi:hypothetical protein
VPLEPHKSFKVGGPTTLTEALAEKIAPRHPEPKCEHVWKHASKCIDCGAEDKPNLRRISQAEENAERMEAGQELKESLEAITGGPAFGHGEEAMSEKVDRVAIVLRGALVEQAGALDGMFAYTPSWATDPVTDEERKLARAAIKEMAEPTDKMAMAGYKAIERANGWAPTGGLKSAYMAMIKEALR